MLHKELTNEKPRCATLIHLPIYQYISLQVGLVSESVCLERKVSIARFGHFMILLSVMYLCATTLCGDLFLELRNTHTHTYTHWLNLLHGLWPSKMCSSSLLLANGNNDTTATAAATLPGI